MVRRFFCAVTAILIMVYLGVVPVSAAGINGNVEFQIRQSSDAAFIVDEKPAVDVKILLPPGAEDTYAIRLITDGRISETVYVDADSPEQNLHLEFAVEEEGYHHLCARLLRNGTLYYEYEFEQYYISSVSNDAYNARGFNIHYTATDEFSDEGEMLRAGGTSVLRVGLSWNSVEKQKGIYNFSKSDEMVASLEKYGFDAICIIDSYHFGHELYPDENGDPMMRTAEQIGAFADFAAAVVSRYPQIKKWEIFNEPNFLMTGEEYFNVVSTVAKRLKAIAPESEIYAGGLAIYDTANFVDGFYIEKLYPFIDGISYHHYNHWRYADGPEYYATTDELVDKMEEEGGWKKLIITESGYSTGVYNMQVPEIKQASENVKRAVICDWYGMDFLTFYDFKNDGYDPAEVEHNFGSVTHDYEPKPGYYAVKQYLNAANRAVYIGEAYLSEDITAHVYAANDDYFMIAWAKNINDEADIRNNNSGHAVYDFGTENVRLKDMFGQPVGGNILYASYQPSYIHGLSREFCLKALVGNKDHDLFEKVRKLSEDYGFSAAEAEESYIRMCTSGATADAENYAQCCYNLAECLAERFLEGTLNLSEAEFSNAVSEIYKVCEQGMRIAVLFDEVCRPSADVRERYEGIHITPQEAAEQNTVYIYEPYYKGKKILNKLSRYEEGVRVQPIKGKGFELKSDNKIIFAGSASSEEVFVKIDDSSGNTVYTNLISTDGSGNYYFELTPEMKFGSYRVTVNDGQPLTEAMEYSAAADYLSVEDKITAISLIQAEKLLDLYEKWLGWTDIKDSYLNPQVDALCWNETKWLNITGRIERSGFAQYSDVILRAYDKNTGELKYIDSTFIDKNGEYRFTFKYDGDAENLDIKINQGGVEAENQVQSVMENRLITAKVSIEPKADTAEIMLQIQNYFKADRTLQPIIIYYDDNDRILDSSVLELVKVGDDENTVKYDEVIPDGVAAVKVFVWDSLEHMKPYAQTVSEDLTSVLD